MKKTAIGLTLIMAVLISYGISFAGLATANPAPLYYFPREPILTPPAIIIYSPIQNETYNSTQVTLNFKVVKPDAWFPSDGKDSLEQSYLQREVLGNITSVYYIVDGGERQNITVHDADYLFWDSALPPQTLSFLITLNLTSGVHTVRIGVEALSYYYSWSDMDRVSYTLSKVVVAGSSEPVNFVVGLPKPVFFSPENIIYNQSDVPLIFTLGNSAASWVGYSLDGKGNTTITGNTTLTGLTNGMHNITLFVNDNYGNTVASQPTNFTVALPPSSQPFPTVPVASASAAVAVVCAGLLLYFRKHRRYRTM